MPERRYSLVHVTAPPDIMVFSAIVPKLFGARIILDIHDIGPELFMRKLNVGEDRLVVRLIKLLERLSASFADHVITVTDFWKDKLAARSVDAIEDHDAPERARQRAVQARPRPARQELLQPLLPRLHRGAFRPRHAPPGDARDKAAHPARPPPSLLRQEGEDLRGVRRPREEAATSTRT